MSTESTNERAVTTSQIAYKYRVCATTVRNWVKAGMPALKVGRVLRIDLGDAAQWLASQGVDKPATPDEATKPRQRRRGAHQPLG